MDSTYNPFLRPLRLKPGIPGKLYVALIFLHVPALFLPWTTAIPLYIKGLISAAVLISLAYHIFFSRLVKTAALIDEAVLHANDEWQVRMVNGDVNSAVFGKRQYVQPGIIILELTQNDSNYFLVLTRDILDESTFRHLRTRIRHRVKNTRD